MSSGLNTRLPTAGQPIPKAVAEGTKRKRLLLVNPVNPTRSGLSITPAARFQPLSLGIIAALTPDSWDVQLADENWEPFIYRYADLVGITAFTASVNRAYQIASLYRKHGVPVVMGGIHGSMCPDEALRFVDAIVIGEAETVWPTVLMDAEAGRLKQIYQGRLSDLSGLVHPRRDLFHRKYAFACVQTSRGCPMDCEFCSVPVFNGQCYRRRPPKEVLDELETIAQRNIAFVDDNIIGHGKQARQQALELFRGMVERRFRKRWVCQASVNICEDEETLVWAGRAGCKVIFLGLEAEEQGALAELDKRLNVRLGAKAYDKMFRQIHRVGIAILGAFILGMDGDTPETVRRRAHYIAHSGVDAMQVTFLTPLPGTRLFNRLRTEGRLLYTDFPEDWDRYSMLSAVHCPKVTELGALLEAVREGLRRLYSWRVLLQKTMRALCITRDIAAAKFVWQANLAYRNSALASSSFTSDFHSIPPVADGG
jgi:radical SAM superfamily enzyme YgiQ (UPF0313 family)